LNPIRPHDRFTRELTLTDAEVSAFARASGDANPLHHDPVYARKTRYGGVIASGPQTSALLMGLVATRLSQLGPMAGLEFSFFFKHGVPANERLQLEWLVVGVTPTSSGAADVVDLRGRLRTASGVTAVGAKGRALVARESHRERA